MAEIECDDSARMTHRLSHGLGAERRGTGLRDPGTVVEVWVAPASGDWLIVQRYANGTSCIVAMGADWERDLSGPA